MRHYSILGTITLGYVLMLREEDIDREMHEKALSLPDVPFALIEESAKGTRLGDGLSGNLARRRASNP